MEAGTKKAELIEVGLKDGGDHGPKPFMKFKTDQGNVYWEGSLKSEKSQKFCVKTLIAAGFVGDSFNELNQPGALMRFFQPRPLEIVVEISEKGYPQVKFVNTEGSGQVKKFTGMVSEHYRGLFTAAKAKEGVTAKPATNEEAPF